MSNITEVKSLVYGNYYIGRLATLNEMSSGQDPIFETNNRFKVNIKILSEIPSELVSELSPQNNIVKALEHRLRPEYSFDAQSSFSNLSKVQKRKELQNDLNGSLVIFKLQFRDGYYNLISASFKAKNKVFSDTDRFDTIPYFKVTDVDHFIEQLKIGSKISEIRSLIQNKSFDEGMLDKNHIPPYLIIEGNDEEVYAFGPLNNIQYDQEGISLIFSKEAHKIIINDEDFLLDNYSNIDELISDSTKITCYFVSTHSSNQIRETLKKNEKKIADDKKKEEPIIVEDIKETDSLNTEKTQGEQIEQKILKRFGKSAEGNGLYYTDQDLYNFHTAMKTGNLVILAGMSGTGKSKIVNCYAEALGLEEHGNLIKIPVRPFWQDDSDLLGYLDVLNNIYRPGDSGLIDFLVKADMAENKDKLFLVCFDEMNLARVEHYFSQFLSILEETGENQRKIRLYNKDYQNRLYNSHKYNDTLKIGENVLFVGTVNLDESTHQFSDKVLDRANVIQLELRKFKEVARAAKEFDVTKSIGTAVFTKDQYFATRPITMEDTTFQLVDEELDFLWKIHEALKTSNDKLGVGFRIVRQIDHYLQCLPQSEVLSRKTAFDLQILQRILTKIRGGEEQLALLVGRYDKVSDEIIGSQLINLFDEYKELSIFTESRNKVTSLAKELVIYGHTL
ncbi:hypothetical protein I2483_09965 [Sporosarcina sp. E16_3]|uniref:McrB family protein n=1 Tax=Sporosarcina sp. E16_3 TaxID=2789293 RepID=UPI001A918B54|nr:hypothetical protein [Sporosarcina sp. E16_3]MBO0601988.1 hypothetical protein [Sporosarcina sp. E16_3]